MRGVDSGQSGGNIHNCCMTHGFYFRTLLVSVVGAVCLSDSGHLDVMHDPLFW